MNVAARQHRVVIVDEYNTSKYVVPAGYERADMTVDVPVEPVSETKKS